MNIRQAILSTVVMGAAVCLAAPVRAQSLDMTLTEGTVTQSGGVDTVDFFATVTNPGTAALYLNADTFMISSPLTLDDTPFFNNAPLSLSAGANSGSFQIFDVSWSAATPVAANSGVFSILGGIDAGTLSDLVDVGFSVTAQSVAAPEIDSSSAAAGLTLMAGILAVLRGRRALKVDG